MYASICGSITLSLSSQSSKFDIMAGLDCTQDIFDCLLWIVLDGGAILRSRRFWRRVSRTARCGIC